MEKLYHTNYGLAYFNKKSSVNRNTTAKVSVVLFNVIFQRQLGQIWKISMEASAIPTEGMRVYHFE